MTTLKIRTDRTALYITTEGAYNESSLHSFPLSACHFTLSRGDADRFILTASHLEKAQTVAAFANEYDAISAVKNIDKSLKRRRCMNKLAGFMRLVFWPAAAITTALAFTVSINGAMMNMNAPERLTENMLQQQMQGQAPVITTPTPQQPAPEATATPTAAVAPAQLPEKHLQALQDAVKNGHFTVKLSTGHKRTLYVFSDPLCPHCRDFEPRLQALSKQYNVEVFPVSVIGDQRSLARAAKVLETPEANRANSWEETLAMPYGERDPALTKGNGEMLVTANDQAFAMFGFVGTPTIVADSGQVISMAVVKDDARLQQFIAEK